VQLIFHAFYNARNRAVTPIGDMMAANLIVRAADNRCWIVASNSCESYSPLPASIVRPDGSSVRARRHKPGIVVASNARRIHGAVGRRPARAWRRTAPGRGT